MWASYVIIIQSATASVFIMGLPVIGGEVEGRDEDTHENTL